MRARHGTVPARISRCSRRMPHALSYACSMRPTAARPSASPFRNTAIRFFTGDWRGSVPERSMATGVHGDCMRAGSRPSIQPQQAAARSRTRSRTRAASNGIRPVLAIRWRAATTSRSTSAIARRSMPMNAWSWTRTSTGRVKLPGITSNGMRTIVYEAHVRGLTRRRTDIGEDVRGTYAGLASAQVIDYIRSLGVTTVELLPVHTFIDDQQLLEKGLSNYWGYNSIGFFAPDPRYAADHLNTLREFKEMVARYHDAGLEIILDVVYNHGRGQRRKARLCPSKASITPATIGCCRISRATTSTTLAPAIRSICKATCA